MNPFDSSSFSDSSCSVSCPHTVPPRSGDVPVNSTAFDTAGNPATQTAPDSVTTARTFDAADRLTILMENSSGAAGTTRTTRYQYTAAGAISKLVSDHDFNQPTTEWQEHGGHATTASPKVQYTYASGNAIRPTGITYPDGTTTIATDYGSAQASALSRPDRISESGTAIASWLYLGLGTVVGRKFDAASGTESTLGTAADGYPGIDRFGRLVETHWQHAGTSLVHTQYGRNRSGGIVWQRNALAHGLTPAVPTEDNYYWYDNLRQVTRHDRGNLVGTFPNYTGIDASTRQQKETSNFDETGNWNNTTAESPWLDQGRTHNVANQITAFDAPSGVTQPQFDTAGNMTVMPRPGAWDASLACTWDAWNRLVKVRSCAGSSSSSDSSSSESSSSGPSSSWSSSSGPSSSSSAPSSSESSSSDSSASSSGSSSSESPSSSSGSSCVDATYQYDALTRRVVTATATETRHFYYNNQWRAVEERVSGAVKAQYVWNPADRWDLIRRKRPVAGAPEETRFVLRDYLDPVAIIDSGGTVTERYRYDAFGPVTVLALDFSTRATSECGWNFLYHAEFLDALTGLYNYGYRWYDPLTGRWPSRDPIGERGGYSLYGFLGNDGVDLLDLLGLIEDKKHCCCGEKNTIYDPAAKCCVDGKVESKRPCTITIYVGHWNNNDKIFADLHFLKEGDKIGIASCLGQSEANEMVRNASDHLIENDKRSAHLVWQQDSMAEVEDYIRKQNERNSRLPEDQRGPPLVWGPGDSLAKDVLKNEIDAANIAAGKLCRGLDGGRCCSSVQIVLKQRDIPGRTWLNRPASKAMGFKEGPYGKPLSCPANCANSGGNLKTMDERKIEREQRKNGGSGNGY